MKHNTITGWILILTLVLSANAGFARPEKASGPTGSEQAAEAEKGVRAANDQFYAALNAMFTGEFAPMEAIWAHRDDITQMGPFGGRMTGWEKVGAEFKKVAEMKLGGRVVCMDLAVRVEGAMGYAVCVEQGENMVANGKPVAVSHRATNIFQRINGQWKLVHHHTDISTQLEAATGMAN